MTKKRNNPHRHERAAKREAKALGPYNGEHVEFAGLEPCLQSMERIPTMATEHRRVSGREDWIVRVEKE
jgi:hypothetical protein